MNFVDAAITLLREHGRPMHVEDLSREAVERGLLTKPGSNPLRSMKGRLTTENNKPESQVTRVEPDVWTLRDIAGGNGAVANEAPPERPAARAPAEPDVASEADAEPAAAPERAQVRDEEAELAELYGDEPEATTPIADLTEYRDEQTEDEDRPLRPEIVARSRGPRRDRKGRRQGKPKRGDRAEARGEKPEAARGEKPEAARGEKPEAARGDGTAKPARGGDRRRGRDRAAAKREREREVAPEVEAEAMPDGPPGASAAAGDAEAAAPAVRFQPGSALADAAYDALAAVKNGQPMQVKQLTQMMRKRRLLEGDPHEMWPLLKAALLSDEQQYRARGLRPRIVYRGRDLFVLGPSSTSADTSDAEHSLAEAQTRLLAATHRVLRDRLSALDLPALERVVQLYLERRGWRNIQWIKRSGPSGYALADPVGMPGPVLVGARAGADPVDRRGVGELRAGLDAKNLPSGLLVAPQDLSEDAVAELARRGRPVSVLTGDGMIGALAAAGIGVVSTAVPVQYVDTEFLDEVGSE